jgi:hypothetical protein
MGGVRINAARIAAALAGVILLQACDNNFLDEIRNKIARDLSTDADLVSFVPSQGFLSPSFTSGVTRYFVTLASATGSVSVTPTTSNPDAEVTVNGTPVGSGAPSGSLALAVGQNPVSVRVTASDRTTVKTYTISVCRSAVDLPQTGQTTSYKTGDDGDLEQGVPFPAPSARFGNNADGTVTDNFTGLMWVQAPGSTTRTWANAVSYANSLAGPSVGNKDDWRLPNRAELRSLFNYYYDDTSAQLNALGFSGITTSYYWTSTSCSPDTARAWSIGFGSGIFDFFPKTGPVLVFPVRTTSSPATIRLPKTGQTASFATGDDGDLEQGVAWPVPRFTDNDDGTITDNLTGLMWEKVLSSATRTWAQAVDYAENLTLAGYADWHLPNINQLESITSSSSPSWETWLEGEGFENVTEGVYWSSTSYAPATPYAWFIITTAFWQGAYQYYQDKNTSGSGFGQCYAMAVRYCR